MLFQLVGAVLALVVGSRVMKKRRRQLARRENEKTRQEDSCVFFVTTSIKTIRTPYWQDQLTFLVSDGLLDAMGETKSSVENCKNIDSIVERVPDSLGINKR